MNIAEIVSANKAFQSSINIDFDFADYEKISSLIPTDSVCKYVEELIKDVVSPSSQRAKLLVGPYGTGKSHITLAALSSMWVKSPSMYSHIVAGYHEKGMLFEDTFAHFATDGPRLLPVIISGSASDLRHSLLYSLRNALRNAGLGYLMPQTNFNTILSVLDRWKADYPDTLRRFEELVGENAESFRAKITQLDTDAYSEFADLYPRLTSGNTFDHLDGANVIEVYDEVLSGLNSEGIAGIYVVYDEFSKYLETNIASATIDDTKLLQDFAEKCNRSGQTKQLHLLLISHKSISNYIDSKLAKDKIDGWRGVSGRFRELEIRNDANQSYWLISEAIKKDAAKWNLWLEENNGDNESLMLRLKNRYLKRGLIDTFGGDVVPFGCFPLHPVSAFLLPALSEKVAQNERTLFTFLCSNEAGALPDILPKLQCFVTPDALFDYFEPLLKKEYYASPIHKTYELAKSSLRRVPEDVLGQKIIKTIAVISIVSQFEKVAPTREAIIDIFCDDGYGKDLVVETMDELAEGQSIVYLRQSNSYLKLKEVSGVPIDTMVRDRAELLQTRTTACSVLNGCHLAHALYPSKHNEENKIIRYFDCGFIPLSALRNQEESHRLLAGDGDGIVAAVLLESPDELEVVETLASNYTKQSPLSVVVVPKTYSDIQGILFKYAAASELKEEAIEDEVLAEEYEIVLEDYAETIREYIDSFFRPETKKSRYYAGGKRKNGISRRRKLSDLLSDLCDSAFPNTPHITSEALNKNELTGIALHSRAKILYGLCGTDLGQNLGFVGNGQETSMMRSALKMTGIIDDFDFPQINLYPDNKRMGGVLRVIEEFVQTSNGDSFEVLFGQLTSAEGKIGMKKGPIPLYLALVLRKYRDEVVIRRGKDEKAFSAELMDDIASNPADYTISLLDWTPGMSECLAELAKIFGCDSSTSRTAVVDAMRRWYVSLPQITRLSKVNHAKRDEDEDSRVFGDPLFRLLRKTDIDSTKLIFEELPKAFGYAEMNAEVIRAISSEKLFCDSYVDLTVKTLSRDLKALFAPNASSAASLDSVLKDWIEGLSAATQDHVFPGVSNRIFDAIKGSIPDESLTTRRIAKAATTLRIEDWNDARFEEFIATIARTKAEIEETDAKTEQQLAASGQLSISYIDSSGATRSKGFDSVECSPRARLLKNGLRSCIEEMGGSLAPEEVRQVVFEVLKEMC